MTLYSIEDGEEIQLTLEYSTSLFKPSTAEKILQRYIDIAKQVIENKHIKLKDIRISHQLLKPKVIPPQEDDGDFDF